MINQAIRYGSAVTSNAGGIHATANGTSGGASFGISNYSQGYVATVDNSGSISATSTAAGIAMATGVENESALYNADSLQFRQHQRQRRFRHRHGRRLGCD